MPEKGMPGTIPAFVRAFNWRLSLLVLVLLAGLFCYRSVIDILEPPVTDGPAPVKRLSIESGMTARQIGELLMEEGIIKNATAFRLLVRYSGLGNRIQAGVYDLTAAESPQELLERFIAGDTVNLAVFVTIPEGYNVTQTAAALAEKGIVDVDEFLALLATAPAPYPHLEDTFAGRSAIGRFEGYLFPDTYQFLPDATAEEVLATFLARFRQVVEPLVAPGVLTGEKEAGVPYPLTLDDLVNLAAIVEKEAVVDAERATIAGVFYNRLNRGQRLESCATVQYILGYPKPNLTYADMALPSPYNTYVIDGLPEGPIASPGKASLLAVVEPEDTPYYYFRAKEDGTGQHIFTKTFAEHQAAGRAQKK